LVEMLRSHERGRARCANPLLPPLKTLTSMVNRADSQIKRDSRLKLHMTITDRLKATGEQHSKFWQNAHFYFDRVYQTMNLDPAWRPVLSTPKRVLTV